MMHKENVEVLVVGAGPVGLFTALCLAHRGLRVMIIDKNWRTHLHSYALALHPASLRLLGELHLAEELIKSGQMIKTISIYEGKTRRAEVAYARLEGEYPFALVLPQSSLEWALEQALKQLKVPVLWNHELAALDDLGPEVAARVDRYVRVTAGYPIASAEWELDKTLEVKAQLVIGADGYDSFVRQRLGADYTLHGSPQYFSVFEVYGAPSLEHEARIVLSDHMVNVLWPLEAEKFRWTFQIGSSAQHQPTMERLTGFLEQRAPWFPAQELAIKWSSLVQFERRLVRRLGRGRIWLAGDAAHLTGPIGVQSMNIGLREAHDLAGRIHAVLRHNAPLDSLDDYNRERLDEWRHLLGLIGDLEFPEPSLPWIKEHASDLVGALPASGPDLEALLRQLGIRAHWTAASTRP